MTGDVLVVASGKGGVGKTVTTVNLAVALRLQDRSVALVDGDLAMPNVGAHLGVEPDVTLHDVLAQDASLHSAVMQAADEFGVLPGGGELDGYASADPARFAYVIDRLSHQYDNVLVDTGGGLSHESALPLQIADETILVTSPDRPAVDDTRRTKALADIVGGRVRGLVVTKVAADTDPERVAGTLGTDLLAAVPYDVAVEQSVATGRPLEGYAAESDAAEAYRRLAARLVGAEPSSTPDGVTV